MARWVVEMYMEVAGDYKFMRCGGRVWRSKNNVWQL